MQQNFQSEKKMNEHMMKIESDGLESFRTYMSLNLRELTNKMVFEGVTPKSGMRRVKAMKKLWRSDSFQILKAILVEPPIQEGRSGPTYNLITDEDDEEQLDESDLMKETPAEKEQKERNKNYSKRKDELLMFYQHQLSQDLAFLKETTDEIIEQLVQQSKKYIQHSEIELLENEIKTNIQKMNHDIKCHKKRINSVLKMTLEEEMKHVKLNLLSYLEKETKIRVTTYQKMLDKVLSFNIKHQADIIEDEYENKLKQKTRISYNKFTQAKKTLITEQDNNLKKLECQLAQEYNQYEIQSQLRKDELLELALEDLEQLTQQEDESMKSQCSIAVLKRQKMINQGLLPKEVSGDEDWSNLVQELIKRYQFLIEIVLSNKEVDQTEYLLSTDRLEFFRKQMTELLKNRLSDVKEKRTSRKIREKAKLRASSVIEQLLKQALKSPPPSRNSLTDLKLSKAHPCKHYLKPIFCYNPETRTEEMWNLDTHTFDLITGKRQSNTSLRSQLLLDRPKKKKHNTFDIKDLMESNTQLVMNRMKLELQKKTASKVNLKEDKDITSQVSSGIMFTEDARKTFVNAIHQHPKLYATLFSTL